MAASEKLKVKTVVQSCQKGVIRNYAKFTGKHLCQSFFFMALGLQLY